VNKDQLIQRSGVFLYAVDLSDPSTVKEYVLEGMNGDLYKSSADNMFLKAMCWPIEVKDELIEICTRRQALKKQFDQSMSLVYQLSNKIARGEVK